MSYFFLLILFLMPALAIAEFTWMADQPEGFRAEVHVPEGAIEATKLLRVRLNLTYPVGYQIDPEALKAHLLTHSPLSFAPFTLDTMRMDENKRNFDFFLQPRRTGNFKLSFYDIAFTPADKNLPVVQIPSGLFAVEIVLESSFAPSDIPVGPLLQLSPYFPISISAHNKRMLFGPESQKNAAQYNRGVFQSKSFPWWQIAVLAGVCLLAFSLQQSAKTASLFENSTARAYRLKTEALRQLLVMERKKNLQKEQLMDFYVKVSSVVRQYLEEKYHIRASTLTTSEFLEKVQNNSLFDRDSKELLKRFLTTADQVKFARKQPSPDKIEQTIHDAQELIVKS